MNRGDQDKRAKLQLLPAVDELLRQPEIQKLGQEKPRSLVLRAIRNVLQQRRDLILHEESRVAPAELTMAALVAAVQQEAARLAAFTLRRVVNAAGVIVHTNLGRSLLCRQALERLHLVGSSYSNLEYDLVAGKRGSRYQHAESILCEITGAEAALVVNNNAGAVLLVLNTLARDREVIISRGELVEIGGSFRIPDVMARSGARLKEVGCTNRTHLHDYEGAIGPDTALILKAHTSNYQIVGFTAEVELARLVELGRRYSLPVMEDLGSGCFVDLGRFGLRGEPLVQDSVRAGVDVVTFSGDKLLGGPQAGIILGRRETIAQIKANPLTRALRVDKLTLAALEATLHLYRDEDAAVSNIPTLRMIAAGAAELAERGQVLAARLRQVLPPGVEVEVGEDESRVGGGALPAQVLPTTVVALSSAKMSAARLEACFRRADPPVIGRVMGERLLLDMRTLQDGDEDAIVAAAAKLSEQI